MDGTVGSEYTGAIRNSDGNLVSAALPQLDWTADHLTLATTLYRWTESSAIATLEWYLREKKGKAAWSRALRALAVILAAVGGVFPFIAVGTGRTAYAFWGYPVLGAAAGCVALDRALGLSSSWMRYLTAAVSIEKLLAEYQLRWAEMCAEINGGNMSAAQFKVMVDEIRQFADNLGDLVIGETRNWVEEFRGHFSRLEAQASNL